MKRLLHMLGQTAADQHQALEEYEQGFKVAHVWATKHNFSDRDAWARVATMPPFKKLKRAICIMLVFLLTETECERTFAEERTVHSGRPRMDPNTRFECLKVKTDGLPFHELHEDGKPVNNCWRCCHDASDNGAYTGGRSGGASDSGAYAAGRSGDASDSGGWFLR